MAGRPSGRKEPEAHCCAAVPPWRQVPVPLLDSHLRGIIASPEVQPLLPLSIGGRRQHHVHLVCNGKTHERGINACLLPRARRCWKSSGSRRRSCRYKPCPAPAAPALTAALQKPSAHTGDCNLWPEDPDAAAAVGGSLPAATAAPLYSMMLTGAEASIGIRDGLRKPLREVPNLHPFATALVFESLLTIQRCGEWQIGDDGAIKPMFSTDRHRA